MPGRGSSIDGVVGLAGRCGPDRPTGYGCVARPRHGMLDGMFDEMFNGMFDGMFDGMSAGPPVRGPSPSASSRT